MVDRIDKELRKLDPKRKQAFIELLLKIVSGNLQGLDVVKLKGSRDIFRVRKGSYRVICRKWETGKINIIAFEHRSESTYRWF